MSCSSFYRSLVRMFSVGVLASLLALPVSARQGKDEMAPAIKTALEAKDYKVEVTFMTPMKGRSRALTSSYYLAVRNDSIFSCLPYVGEAYSVPYGGGKGLVFDAPIERYEAEPGKKGRMEIQIKTRNEEDSYLYRLTVQPNGSVSVNVQPTRRQPISFSGRME